MPSTTLPASPGLRTVALGMPTADEIVSGTTRELSSRPRLPQTLGELEGAAAFFDILAWKGGEFSVERGAVARKRTIVQKATELLIDALRLQDEAVRPDRPPTHASASAELETGNRFRV